MDKMQAMEIISEYEGSKPRQVLITKEMWEEMKKMSIKNFSKSL